MIEPEYDMEDVVNVARYDAMRTEIKRLRTALETIAKYHDDLTDSACAQIAIRTLEK